MSIRESLFVAFSFLLVHASVCAEPIDISQAVALADSTIGGPTGRPSRLELVTAKKYDTPVNEVLPRNPETGSHRALASKLSNRSYWLIRYRPKETAKGDEIEGGGGDVAVFVDATSKEIIHVSRWR